MVSESHPDPAAASQACPIKTVVVLVQENRSFDHMLGWMRSLNPDIDGVDGTESNPLSVADSNSLRIPYGDSAVYVDPDPDHSFQAIYEQVFGEPWEDNGSSPSKNLLPSMEGFAQNAERKQKGLSEFVMNGFKPEAVPVYKELVSEFAVCDRWFASIPASTQPNRLYVHAATSCGATGNDTQKLVEGYPQRTRSWSKGTRRVPSSSPCTRRVTASGFTMLTLHQPSSTGTRKPGTKHKITKAFFMRIKRNKLKKLKFGIFTFFF